MEVPEELFAGDLNDRRILGLVCKVDRSPHALAHEDQDGEDHCGNDQEYRFNLRIIVPVRCVLAAVASVPRNEESKRSLNKYKSNASNGQHRAEETVNPGAVLRGQHGKP